MATNKVVQIEDRIPKLREQRKQKANRRFIFYITLFFLLIIMVIYFKSPLSTVGKITVKGNHFVSTNQILSESKIKPTTHIWDIHIGQLKTRIEQLPAVSSVTITRSFPNHLLIHVSEYRRIAYIKNESKYVPILENGAYLSTISKQDIPVSAPILVNWTKGALLNQFAKQLSLCQSDIISEISEAYSTPSKDDQEGVTLYMNDGNKVLADINSFSSKMKYYPDIASIKSGQKGIVNLRVGMTFTPYNTNGEAKKNEK